MNLLIPNLPQQLSFSKSLSTPQWHFLHNNKNNNLSFSKPPSSSTIIRMGGGPRTYPGGVSKWQWKRMQAKKAKQLLKARLCRERQMYEMRKRAELKAAVSELERPWEVVEKAPTLFSVKADEQVKVLADRFQKPGGFDLWSVKDGPQLFETPDDLPSARFFPKGVVHSVKPYTRVDLEEEEEEEDDEDGGVNGVSFDGRLSIKGNGRRLLSSKGDDYGGEDSSSPLNHGRSGVNADVRMRKSGNGRRFLSKDGDGSNSGRVGSGRKQRGSNSIEGRSGGKYSRGTSRYASRRVRGSDSEVFDMGLQQDGSYEFLQKSEQSDYKS